MPGRKTCRAWIFLINGELKSVENILMGRVGVTGKGAELKTVVQIIFDDLGKGGQCGLFSPGIMQESGPTGSVCDIFSLYDIRMPGCE